MKVYLAGERSATVGANGYFEGWAAYARRRLFSFYYHGYSQGGHGVLDATGASLDITQSVQANMDLFLDSGAFTGFTKKKEIPVEEYGAYLNKYGHLFTTRSNLDDTSKNEKKSYNNQKALESMGCVVQPVFHAREDVAWLVKYLDEGYDYIFIGGMVPESTQWLTGWLDWLWEKYLSNPDGTPRVKTHGFGLTDQKLMFRYPWHSVDSTSWLMTGIFGAAMFRVGTDIRKIVFSDESPEARKFQGWHYNRLPRESQRVVDTWLEPFSLTAAQLSSHYSFRDIVNAATFQQLEDMGATHYKPEMAGLFT